MIFVEKKTSKISPEGIIGVLFRENPHLKFYLSNFHKSFFDLKKKGKYGDLLKEIRFAGSAVNPYSEEINCALSNLQSSGALAKQNPDLVKYSTTTSFNSTFEILTENLSADIIDEVIGMCKDLLGILDYYEKQPKT